MTYITYTIRHVRWGITSYSGPRVTLEGLNSRSMPQRTCLIVFQTYHAAKTVRAQKPVRTRAAVEPNRDVSKPPWHPLVVREHVVEKACHLHAKVLPMMTFHGEYMSKRRNRVIMMFPVTFEATVKLTPANLRKANVPLVPYIF